MFGFNLGSLKAYLKLDTREWTRGKKSVKADLIDLGKHMALFGAAVTGFMGANVREFGKFDQAIREALAVSDVTTEQFEQMSRMAEEASIRLNKAATETAKGFYFLGSAGLTATEQMQSYNSVVDMARAMTVDVGQAAEGLVDIMRGFNIEFTESAHVADILVKTIISSNQVFSDLDKALSYVSSTANTTNNTLAETVAMLGVMANAGIKGSYAGVALRRSFTNLMSPTAEMNDLIRELGLDLYDARGEMKPFIDIMGEINYQLRNASERYKGMVFEILFGRRAIAGQIKIFEYGEEALRAYADEIENVGDVTGDIVAKQLAAFFHQIGRVWRMAQGLSREIGAALAPSIRVLADEINNALPLVKDWVKENRELAVQIVKITTAVGLLSLAFGSLLLILPTVVKSLTMIFGLLTSPLAVFVLMIASLYTLRAVWKDTFKSMEKDTDTLESNDILKGLQQTITQIMWQLSLIPDIVEKAFSGEAVLNTLKYFTKALQQIGLMARMVNEVIFTPRIFWKDTIGKLQEEYDKLQEEMSVLLHGGDGFSLFGSEEERNKDYADFKKDINVVFGELGNIIKKEYETIGGIVVDQFKQDLDAVIAVIKDKHPKIAKLLEDMAKLWEGITAPVLPTAGDTPPKYPQKPEEHVGPPAGTWAYSWWLAAGSVMDSLNTVNDAFTDINKDMLSGMETAFGDFMQQGGNFRDFMDDIFNAIYQSFVNFIAKLAAQDMWMALFKPEEYERKALGTPGSLLGMIKGLFGGVKFESAATQPSLGPFAPPWGGTGHPEIGGQFAGKVSVVMNNSGPPVEMDITSTEQRGDEVVLVAAMRLAKSSRNFRDTFMNEVG